MRTSDIATLRLTHSQQRVGDPEYLELWLSQESGGTQLWSRLNLEKAKEMGGIRPEDLALLFERLFPIIQRHLDHEHWS